MCAGPVYSNAVTSMKILRGPDHSGEGFNGYIETDVEFEIKDILVFANLWNSFYSLSDRRKLDLYGLAKGLGDCK